MISFWISVVPPKIETILLNPGRANDFSAQSLHGITVTVLVRQLQPS